MEVVYIKCAGSMISCFIDRFCVGSLAVLLMMMMNQIYIPCEVCDLC